LHRSTETFLSLTTIVVKQKVFKIRARYAYILHTAINYCSHSTSFFHTSDVFWSSAFEVEICHQSDNSRSIYRSRCWGLPPCLAALTVNTPWFLFHTPTNITTAYAVFLINSVPIEGIAWERYPE